MIDANTGLVIECDNGEGTADKSCPQGTKSENCFHDIAKFKRIVKIELNDANVGGPVRKIGYIDLMKIADPSIISYVQNQWLRRKTNTMTPVIIKHSIQKAG